MLLENKRNETITVREDYGTFSINGLMSNCSFSNISVDPKGFALVEIHLYEYMMEDAEISSIAEIQEFGIDLEINNKSYKTLEEIAIQYTILVNES